MAAITARIDSALERMELRGWGVRAIYLDDPDHAALTKWWTRTWRKKLGSRAEFIPLSYRDHPICLGQRSRVYSDRGCEVSIPKRLSPRVRELVA